VVLGHGASLALRLVSTLVLTRLFAPAIFGIFAIAISIQTVISLISDLGLRQAIVQSPTGADRSFLDTAWTLQILRCCWIWGVAVAAAAGLYAADLWRWLPPDSVYSNPSLPWVIALTSFSGVIGGFKSIKVVTANRNLDLKRITLIELISQSFSLAVIVSVGWVTRSIWSFVAGSLASAALTTLLSHIWLPGPVDRFGWDREALQELMRFGKWSLISSSLTTLAGQSDRLLLGGWANPTVVGNYSIASNISMLVDGIANQMYGRVLLPTFSEVARLQPERLPSLYLRMRLFADPIFVGMAGFLFAAGGWVTGLLYDARYALAGQMLQSLSFGLLFTRYGLTHSAYIALGRPSYLTPIYLTKLVSLFGLTTILFYAFGIQGAILGIAFHQFPTLFWVFWFNRRHRLNNFRLELAVLGSWPLGWLAGYALVNLARI
jgi:O-antigen/teichoic acid export membrane protein